MNLGPSSLTGDRRNSCLLHEQAMEAISECCSILPLKNHSDMPLLKKGFASIVENVVSHRSWVCFVVYFCGSASEASTSIQATQIIFPLPLSFRSFHLQCSKEKKIFKCVSVWFLLITEGSCTITKYAGLILRVSTHSPTQRRDFWSHLMTDWFEKMEQVLKRWMFKQWY